MSQNRVIFIEEAIIEAVKGFLVVGVNNLLGTLDEPIPLIEFDNCCNGNVGIPAISISASEPTEKERLGLFDAYILNITIPIWDNPDSVFYAWVYSCALDKVFTENRTLGGIVDCSVITSQKIRPPNKKQYRDTWEVTITLRATVDAMVYAGKWL